MAIFACAFLALWTGRVMLGDRLCRTMSRWVWSVSPRQQPDK